jgi:hypothetical protein
MEDCAVYERFDLLASSLHLPTWRGRSIQGFFAEIKRRLDTKAIRLCTLMPGLSHADAREAVARSSAMMSWVRVEEIFGRIQTHAQLGMYVHDVVDVFPAAFEPEFARMPLTPLQRVAIRWFGGRLKTALRLDTVHACEIAARLYGAKDWRSLVGDIPFLPISQPLYDYRRDADGFVHLDPCAAARQCDEDFHALTQLRHDMFRSELAQDEFVDRPGLLCAASVGATCAIEEDDFDSARFRASRCLAEVDRVFPIDCRAPLAPDVPAHAWYIRVRAALFASLRSAGSIELAEDERTILMTRGREYRSEYEALLRNPAPSTNAPQKRMLRLVS